MTKQQQFEKAVEWLTPICARNLNERRVSFPEGSLSEVLLKAFFGLIPQVKQIEKPREKHYAGLVVRAAFDHGAYKVACAVACAFLEEKEPLPSPIAQFVQLVLVGLHDKPKPERRDHTWLENMLKYTLILRTVTDFDLKPTRGDENDKLSACDAVSDAFDKAGHGVDFYALKRLCTEKRFQALRDEAGVWSLGLTGVTWQIIEERLPVTQQHLNVHFPLSNCDTPS